MVEYVCAAKHLCGVPTMKIPRMMNKPDGKPQHMCDGCGLDMHSAAFCGYLTDDVIYKLNKRTLPKGFGTKVGGTVCKLCYQKHAVDTPAATIVDATLKDGHMDDLPSLLHRDGAGGKRLKGDEDPASAKASRKKRPRKAPKEYSIKDKLAILDEIKLGMASQEAICKQRGVSRRSVANWKKQEVQFLKVAAEDGRGGLMRVHATDKLSRIKDGVRKFYDLNNALPKALKIPITRKSL